MLCCPVPLRLMLRESRRIPSASVNLVFPPTMPAADAGFVIMEPVSNIAPEG